MKTAWCWACRKTHPMLDEHEFQTLWRAWKEAENAYFKPVTKIPGETPRQTLERINQTPKPPLPPELQGLTSRQILYRPLQQAYEAQTGLKFEGNDPKAIMHYRISFYGPPCPYCGVLLRNMKAKQCFECGADWHNDAHVIFHKKTP